MASQVLGNLKLVEVLGVGAYGVVYRAINPVTTVSFAVKALTKDGLDVRQRTFHDREVLLHQQASSHPNVVAMYDIIDCPNCTFVVLEYLPERDLFSNIVERGLYVGDDVLAKTVFLQLLDAVEYCQSLGIYHRDLKPENILVADGGLSLKLADFGLATQEAYSADFGCGSTFYMSPGTYSRLANVPCTNDAAECQETPPDSFVRYACAPNDVWSLGVILVNLTCGRNPWKRASADDSTFSSFLQDSEFLKTILPLSDELDSILRRVFECDPRRRITIPELRAMILRCSTFTTSADASETKKPKLLNSQNASATSTHDVPTFQPPLEVYQPDRYVCDITARLSQLSTGSGSSGSNRSSWSNISAVSSASSTGSFQNVSPAPKVETQIIPQAPVSHTVQARSTPWLSIFDQFTQKHMPMFCPPPAYPSFFFS